MRPPLHCHDGTYPSRAAISKDFGAASLALEKAGAGGQNHRSDREGSAPAATVPSVSKHDETKIYGRHACRAVFRERPQDLVRALLTEKCASEFTDLLKFMAEQRMVYRLVPQEELDRFCDAQHHEGICIVTRAKWCPPLEDIVGAPGPGQILALDKVGNPHNIGTLLRTAVHFGVRAVLIGGPLRRLSSAAYRTAEGAAEFIDVYFAADLEEPLSVCKAGGFEICATSSHQGRSLYAGALPERAVILLGAERDGLQVSLMKGADHLLCIPGSEKVESLNVASSAAVLMAEHWRQHAQS